MTRSAGLVGLTVLGILWFIVFLPYSLVWLAWLWIRDAALGGPKRTRREGGGR